LTDATSRTGHGDDLVLEFHVSQSAATCYPSDAGLGSPRLLVSTAGDCGSREELDRRHDARNLAGRGVGLVVGVVIVVFSLESTVRSDVPVHIGTPRPRATVTDQLEARSANHVFHRSG
jgi:hypothetical protein